MPRLVGPHRQRTTAHAKKMVAGSGAHVVRHKAPAGAKRGRRKGR